MARGEDQGALKVVSRGQATQVTGATTDSKTLQSFDIVREKLNESYNQGRCPEFYRQAGLELVNEIEKTLKENNGLYPLGDNKFALRKDTLSADGVLAQAIEDEAREICQEAGWPEQLCLFTKGAPHVSGTSNSPFMSLINGLERMSKATGIYIIVHEAGHGRDKLIPSKLADPLDASYRSISSYILLEGLNDMMAFDILEKSGYTKESIIQGSKKEDQKIYERSIKIAAIAQEITEASGLDIADINHLSQSDAQVAIARGLGITRKQLDALLTQRLIQDGIFTKEQLQELEVDHQEAVALEKSTN